MQRNVIIVLLATLTGISLAQSSPGAQPQSPPAQSQQQGTQPPAPPRTSGQQQVAPGQSAGPQSQAPAGGPRKVQAHSQAEFDAYKLADASVTSDPDLAKGEAAATDFQTKFPQSELTSLLYDKLMKRYQQANNAEKTIEMGRKELAL